MTLHNGFLCLNKPSGPSSFELVRCARKLFATRKAGHGGTLDPLASGVLVVAVNEATRLLPFLDLEPKEYRFSIQFGAETDTLDHSGTVVRSGGSFPGRQELDAALTGLCGTIEQFPPRYSAVKINGHRAYELARRGRSFELKPRQVVIHALELCSYEAQLGRAVCFARCSSGTYVRSLARDIAYAAGTVAHTTAIARERAGAFTVERSLTPVQLETNGIAALIPPWEVLDSSRRYVAGTAVLGELAHGRTVSLCGGSGLQNGTVFVFDDRHRVAAVCERGTNDELHPVRVFSAATAHSAVVGGLACDSGGGQ